MTHHEHTTPVSLALFSLAEIKAAIAAFEEGEVNLFDTLDAIMATVEAFRSAAAAPDRREAA